jgi:tetratricopeptide (TPR) repeat protein
MRKVLWGVAAAMILTSTALRAEGFCGELTNHFGPFDYRKRTTEYAHELFLVHSAHFSSDIENGIKGRSSSLAGELDYTLRAFPNHIRALAALDRIDLRGKTVKSGLESSRFPVECYFERAVRFAPDDGEARAAYGSYLFARGKLDASLKMFIEAERLSPDDASINYNLALVYVKVKDYEKANLYGQKAYKLGFPLPGLKNQLVAAGQWKPEAE